MDGSTNVDVYVDVYIDYIRVITYVYGLYVAVLLVLIVIPCPNICKTNENEPTTQNYWTNMDACNKYSRKLRSYLKLKEMKKKKIVNLQSSFRRGTLRNRNPDNYYANEEDIQSANEELEKIETETDKLHKLHDYYYMKTVEITNEMNRIDMWELSS
jgi:hypothetical protein